MPLNPKEQRVFKFISGYIAANSESPTISEIGRHFQITSSASVHKIVTALEREGLIKKVPNVSRGIKIVGHEG